MGQNKHLQDQIHLLLKVSPWSNYLSYFELKPHINFKFNFYKGTIFVCFGTTVNL